MTQVPTVSRLIAAGKRVAVLFAAPVLVTACAAHAQQLAESPAKREVPAHSARPVASATRPASSPTRPAASATPMAVAVGAADTYEVGEREMTFLEPAHTGPTGESLGQRTLVTQIWYPRAERSGGSRPTRGPFPLLAFAPGFMECPDMFADLLRTWASAGYVVAAVNFPQTDCAVGAAAYEPDLVNQPGDVSYMVTQLLALSARQGNALSGLLNPHEVAAAGHSDGGDTAAALAGNTCCTDHRLKAVAVLSGQEWPQMPGQYFADETSPMLFVQGSADTINTPSTNLGMYLADHAPAKYYLDLFGENHLGPYTGTSQVERLVAQVTLEYFDRYVLGQSGATATMTRDGNVSGTAALVSNGQSPP